MVYILSLQYIFKENVFRKTYNVAWPLTCDPSSGRAVPTAAACSVYGAASKAMKPVRYIRSSESRNPFHTSVSYSVLGPAFLPAASYDMGLYSAMFSVGPRNTVTCVRCQVEKRRCETHSSLSHERLGIVLLCTVDVVCTSKHLLIWHVLCCLVVAWRQGVPVADKQVA